MEVASWPRLEEHEKCFFTAFLICAWVSKSAHVCCDLNAVEAIR